MGFSQGAMMALHVGLRRAVAPAAVIGYSGLLAVRPGAGQDLKADILSSPPVLLIHGDQDDVVPVDCLYMARDALDEVGIDCRWHVCPGLGHGIDADGLRLGEMFLSQHLNPVIKTGP